MALQTNAVKYGPDYLVDGSNVPLRGVACVITDANGTQIRIYNGASRLARVPQPVNCDDAGALTFWADPGSYTVTPASGASPYTIKIAADSPGGGSTPSLAGLADVIATAPADGQVLAYVNAASSWEPSTLVGLPAVTLLAKTNDYTLALADAGKLVTLSKGSGVTLTVPANVDVAFPVGSRVDVVQLGAGQVTIAAAAGATVSTAAATSKLTAQYSKAALVKVATNTWILSGDLAAS